MICLLLSSAILPIVAPFGAASDVDALWIKFNVDARDRFVRGDTVGAEGALRDALFEAGQLAPGDFRYPVSLLHAGVFHRVRGKHAVADSLLGAGCEAMRASLKRGGFIETQGMQSDSVSAAREAGARSLKSARFGLAVWIPEWRQEPMLLRGDLVLLFSTAARIYEQAGDTAAADSLVSAARETPRVDSPPLTECQQFLLEESLAGRRPADERHR